MAAPTSTTSAAFTIPVLKYTRLAKTNITTAELISATDAVFQNAFVLCPTGAAASISIGPDSNADLWTISAGTMFQIPIVQGARQNLKDWYIKSAGAATTARIYYI